MPQKKYLNIYEKQKIFNLHSKGWSFRKIGKKINRSHKVVSKLINDPFSYGTKISKAGRKAKLSKRCIRSLVFSVGVRKKSLRQAARDSLEPVSHQTVGRLMRRTTYRYIKIKTQIKLKPSDKIARINFSQNMLKLGEEILNNIIFSDEKRFNIDGPDGYRHYWHDLRKEKDIFSKSKYVAGIMVWGAICYNGSSVQVFINANVNARNYVEMLDEALLPIIDKDVQMFQQDNAPAHRSQYTKHWLLEKGIQTIDWPSNSPDLNLIENVWGILTRRIYRNSRNFNNINELKDAITEEWEGLERNIYVNLYRSFPDRLIKVLMNKGNVIDK